MSKLCGPCEDAKAVTFIAGGLALVLVAALVVTTLVVLPNMPSVRNTETFKLVGKFDSGSIKCIWVRMKEEKARSKCIWVRKERREMKE